jgi:low affinity Fe/Cu permease
MNKFFRRFAEQLAVAVGTPWAFMAAVFVLMAWAATGPSFGYSQHWQLVVNSFTTIITFLMVFVIQNTQNRDFQALQLKLDELLRVSPTAHRGIINLQELTDVELHSLERAYQQLREESGATSEQVIEEISRSLEKRPRD